MVLLLHQMVLFQTSWLEQVPGSLVALLHAQSQSGLRRTILLSRTDGRMVIDVSRIRMVENRLCQQTVSVWLTFVQRLSMQITTGRRGASACASNKGSAGCNKKNLHRCTGGI